jgi:hypothetical protein
MSEPLGNALTFSWEGALTYTAPSGASIAFDWTATPTASLEFDVPTPEIYGEGETQAAALEFAAPTPFIGGGTGALPNTASLEFVALVLAQPLTVAASSADSTIIGDTARYGASYALFDELSAVITTHGNDIWSLADPGPVIVESATLQLVLNQIMSEQLGLSPRARFLIVSFLADGFEALDSPSELVRRVFAVAEAVRVIEGLSPQLVLGLDASDTVSATEALTKLVLALGADSMDFVPEALAASRRVAAGVESLRLSDGISTASQLLLALAEGVSAADSISFDSWMVAEELLELASESNYEMAILAYALERLSVGDSSVLVAEWGLSLEDAAALTDAISWVAAAAALEALDLLDSPDFTVTQILRCIEALAAVTPASAAVQLLAALSDVVSAQDILAFAATLPVEDTTDFTDEAPLDYSNLAFAFESFNASVTVQSSVQLLFALLEAPIIGDALRIRFGLELADAADLAEAVEADVLRLLHAIELVTTQDTTSYAAVLNLNLSDSVAAVDFVRSLFLAQADDTFEATTDAVPLLMNFFAAVEGIALAQATSAQIALYTALAEAATLRDILSAFDELVAAEAVDVAAASDASMRVLLRALSSVRALDSVLVSLLLEAGLEDTVALGELLRSTLTIANTDSVDLTSESGLELMHTLAALSRLSAVANVSTTVSLSAMLMEQLLGLDLATVVQGMSAEEVVSLTDTLTAAIRAQLAAADSLALADEAQRSFFMLARADENAAFADSMAASLRAWLTLAEGIAFVGLLPLEDGDYQAWAINTDSLGVTQYTNFPFDGLETHKGSTYGLTETGLYELVGDTDEGAPIEAMVRTGMLTFGSTHLKRVTRAFLYITQDDSIYLRVVSEQRGVRDCTTYEISPLEQYDAQLRRVKLGREVRGTAWSFEIGNVDGGSLDLGGAEVLPIVLSRRW